MCLCTCVKAERIHTKFRKFVDGHCDVCGVVMLGRVLQGESLFSSGTPLLVSVLVLLS